MGRGKALFFHFLYPCGFQLILRYIIFKYDKERFMILVDKMTPEFINKLNNKIEELLYPVDQTTKKIKLVSI